MKKLAICALATLSLALVACDEASKEKLNATVEEAKQHASGLQEEAQTKADELADSASDKWQQAKKQAGSSVVELLPGDTAAQIEQAKEKVTAVGDLTISDLLGMGDKENAEDAAQAGEEDEN